MQVVLGSLFLLLLSTSHGWQIRDRIGDNELEERIIYPGKRERLIEEMNRLFTHSSLRDFHFVVSGTLWCGHGNKSSGPNELGRFKHTDACCRTHDMCPDVMSAGESKHGLTNTASHTRFPSPASLSLSLSFRSSPISRGFLSKSHFLPPSEASSRLFNFSRENATLSPLSSYLRWWTHARGFHSIPTDGAVTIAAVNAGLA